MPSQSDSVAVRAVCVLRATDNANLHGAVHFSQTIGMNQLKITGEISGLPVDRKLAVHIHQYGDLTNGPVSAGARFHPERKASTSSKDQSAYTADVGYLQVNAEGHAKIDFIDKRSTLFGPHSIIGRSVVISDEKEEDVVRVETEENKGPTVTPTNRLAAGVIGICQ